MRFPNVKLLVIAVLPIVLGLLGFGLPLWIKAAESSRWEDMKTKLTEMARETRARSPERSVLRGEARPGNAWDDYAEILAIPPSPDLYPAIEFLERNPKADRAKLESLVSRRASAVEALRRGASRSGVDRRTAWEEGSNSIQGIYAAGCLAGAKARLLAEEGRAREAAELLLDTCQFGMDALRNTTEFDGYSGVGVLSACLRELSELIASGRLGHEELLEVVRELELLDRGFPNVADCHLNSAMALGFFFLKKENVATILKHYEINSVKISAWRFGFSERLLIVDAFESALSGHRRQAGSIDKPWTEAQGTESAVFTEYCNDRNPLVRLLFVGPNDGKPKRIVRVREVFREGRAHLRMVRTAARAAATGDILELEDPFGQTLRWARTENRFKVWSVGGDGVDDGGAGEWKPGKGKDIVLELSLPKD